MIKFSSLSPCLPCPPCLISTPQFKLVKVLVPSDRLIHARGLFHESYRSSCKSASCSSKMMFAPRRS